MIVRIPAPLRKFAGNKEEVPLEGTTIGEVLQNLCAAYGDLKQRLFKEDGTVHRYVNVYINDEDMRYFDDLKTPVTEADEICILSAVAGG